MSSEGDIIKEFQQDVSHQTTRPNGVASGAVESRYVRVADDNSGQHATRRHPHAHDLSMRRLQSRVKPGEGGFNRVPVREAAHPNVAIARPESLTLTSLIPHERPR
jgi:hypothetical protein